MFETIFNFGIPIFLILLGWLAGSAAERHHLRSLRRREKELSYMLLTDIKTFPGGAEPAVGALLVMGEAVIASDYLKSFLAGLRKLVGGRLNSYQSLLERGRREAILRMMAQARARGCDAVCNLRLGTATIGRRMIEVHASGTAYRRPQSGSA